MGDIRDWHIRFDVQADIIDSQNFVRLEPEIKDIIFNKAINTIVLQLYKQYESTQEITDEIRPLITPKEIVTVPYKTDSYSIELPSDYYYHLSSSIQLTVGNTTAWVNTKKQEIDDINKVFRDPFNIPTDEEVPIYFIDKGIIAFTPPNYNASVFSLLYLRKPTKVEYKTTTSTELPESIHERIINLALTYALETYKDERISTQPKMPVE